MRHVIAILLLGISSATAPAVEPATTMPAAEMSPAPIDGGPVAAGGDTGVAADGATERACYLGVATSTATQSLRDQLRLPRGVGVVVEMVDPDSPAELAGLEPRDVIREFNDQVVINIQQLSVLVRLQKPGGTAKLSVLRHGQSMNIEAKLVERELPVLDDSRAVLPAAVLPRAGLGRTCSVITHTDGDAVLTLVTREDDRHLTVKTLHGTQLYDGPLNTPDDEMKVPATLRDKLRRVLDNAERMKAFMPRGN